MRRAIEALRAAALYALISGVVLLAGAVRALLRPGEVAVLSSRWKCGPWRGEWREIARIDADRGEC